MSSTGRPGPDDDPNLGVPKDARRLRDFTGQGYDKGRSRLVQASWFLVMHMVFVKWWLPASLRPPILRLFGASVGKRVLIRHRVTIQWPWKVSVGDDTWIGEGAWLITLEPITIGSNVCISQGATLCTGSHDRRSATFEFDNAQIEIEDGAWIATHSVVLRGAHVKGGETVPALTVRRAGIGT